MPHFADIILPLALPRPVYTYAIPDDLLPEVQTGRQVEVAFGKNKRYLGIVRRVHTESPPYQTKPILAVSDESAFVSEQQLEFWEWMATYYCCTLGEVMQAALPAQLKLSSETRLVRRSEFGDDFSELDAEEYLVAEALLLREEISLGDVRKILNKKTVMPVVQHLLNKGVLLIREQLRERYRPKKVIAVELAEPYRSQPNLLAPVLDELARYERQQEVLLAYLHLSRQRPWVSRQEILDKAQASDAALKALVKKGVLAIRERHQSRIAVAGSAGTQAKTEALTPQQAQALEEILSFFRQKKPVLLHGVTGSGKTRVYVELIQNAIQAGGQVLYMLPEIALTTQIIQRLQGVFGEKVVVYHSKVSDSERVEIWRAAAEGRPVFLTARSGLFLPFKNLQLIIVDEEHDPSFKQQDPAPRYQARDSAIYLARLCCANVLLGTATPSLESWHNAQIGKYGLVSMPKRFGDVPLPTVRLVDLREQQKSRQMQSIFSATLIEALEQAIGQGEQAILFQNRRGYAPILECKTCGWVAECRHCDVSLTYHKQSSALRCHYCGYTEKVPPVCPACNSGKLVLLGSGTEKIEDELRILLPKVRIARLDLDTAGSRSNLNNILNDFEERRIDVLVGTQMITKGLDFDNVAVVGVIGADLLVRFPDFRSGERAFQLLTQVAGRAGRKNKRGLVLVQTWNPQHPVLQEVLRGDFASHAQRELQERKLFGYPPFARIIRLYVRHPKEEMASSVAHELADTLRQQLAHRVLGPTQAPIGRLRGSFIWEILLKMEKSMSLLEETKRFIFHLLEQMSARPGFTNVRLYVDVDPY